MSQEIPSYDYIIKKGKHKGFSLLDLLDKDPEFIVEMHESETLVVDEEIYMKAVAIIEEDGKADLIEWNTDLD